MSRATLSETDRALLSAVAAGLAVSGVVETQPVLDDWFVCTADGTAHVVGVTGAAGDRLTRLSCYNGTDAMKTVVLLDGGTQLQQYTVPPRESRDFDVNASCQAAWYVNAPANVATTAWGSFT
jgi:hypothetical protein